MKVLIVDMTHGGAIIASEFMKLPNFEVFAWDIYSTMEPNIRDELMDMGLKFVETMDKDYLDADEYQAPKVDCIVAPVHCKLESEVNMTHHEAVGFLLKDRINIPVIEVTGVKGKTSVVWMLKEIFKDFKPLVLSSLGVEVLEDGDWKVLKQNISITPASIIEAWELAEGHEIGICIFETSLGGTGLADVGILTNLVEDYQIAGGSGSASDAKLQIFNSRIVVCEQDSFNSKFIEFLEKTNTFYTEVNSKNPANVTPSQIRFGFDETIFQVDIVDFKTLGKDIINDRIELSTFAPAPIHISNVLAALSASLTLEVPLKKIKEGLNNFKGVKGRTSIKEYKGIRVIEEINPGLNVTAVKMALDMMGDMEDVGVIFGGKYGVTCEEIDEESVSRVLDNINDDHYLILVDELGSNLKNILKRNYEYYSDLNDAMGCAVKNKCSNILLIYRSNFSDIKKR